MKLVAAIFDWAGTTVDHGSLAPVRVMQKLFAKHEVELSSEEARAFMGLPKRDHIAKTLTRPRVRQAWTDRYAAPPDDSTVAQLFAEFIPMQLDILPGYSALISGVAAAIERMRARGLKIGSTTGYTRPMLNVLLEQAALQGYRPDCAVAPDDVAGGRPHPWMIYENAIRMKVEPLWAMVKIGDTASDIDEGRNAGLWTVGVVRTGNLIGLSEDEWDALPDPRQNEMMSGARERMTAAGAHYVIDGVASIDPVLDQIDQRLSRGERP